MSVARRFRFIDGEVREVTERDTSPVVDRGPMLSGAYSQAKPLRSISMGCHPEQVDLLNNAMRQHGVQGVEWDRRGRCNITSRKGRAKAMPIFGKMVGLSNVHDDSGGYGDG